MDYEPLKGRPMPRIGDRLRVHRNLNRRWDVWYSVSLPHGTVLGYTTEITLAEVTVRTNGHAQALIAGGAARSVHAWAVGTLVPTPVTLPAHRAKVIYRPHESPDFRYADTDAVFEEAELMLFTRSGVFAA